MPRVAFALVMLLAAVSSDAQVIDAQVVDAQRAEAKIFDLAAIRCKEFLELGQDRIGSILLWLDGYYTADEDPVVVDFDRAKTKAAQLAAYCAQHPGVSLIAAAESVLGK
jgi:acid stress chaperone HdeB